MLKMVEVIFMLCVFTTIKKSLKKDELSNSEVVCPWRSLLTSLWDSGKMSEVSKYEPGSKRFYNKC